MKVRRFVFDTFCLCRKSVAPESMIASVKYIIPFPTFGRTSEIRGLRFGIVSHRLVLMFTV